jgi:hypothetical protein
MLTMYVLKNTKSLNATEGYVALGENWHFTCGKLLYLCLDAA